MAKSIKPEDLGAAIEQELTLYHDNIVEKVNSLGEETIKKIAAQTKATAPVGARGSYKEHITSGVLKKHPSGNTYAWYVKKPDYRLTHLLVHGHATRDGGRTRADPFLKKAADPFLPKYERDVEEAVKNG